MLIPVWVAPFIRSVQPEDGDSLFILFSSHDSKFNRFWELKAII